MGFREGMTMKFRLALMVVSMALAGAVNAQEIAGAPYIAVQGEAKQEVVPDLFPVKIILSETSVDAATTQGVIESLASDLLRIAARMKVPERDLTVSNLSISPGYKYDRDDQKQVFLGNTYQREINLRFHTLDALRDFIAALPEAKAMRIDTGEFLTSRAEELRRGLLQQAIANARSTAEAMAAGIGRKLGAVHTISNQGFNMRYSRSVNAIDVSSTESVALLAPGTVAMKKGVIELKQSVYIIYTLVD